MILPLSLNVKSGTNPSQDRLHREHGGVLASATPLLSSLPKYFKLNWLIAGCWAAGAGWCWVDNYPGEMLRLLTLISPVTADNGLLSFDQRNLVNIQHSLTVIKTVITSDQAFSDGLSELHSDITDLAYLPFSYVVRNSKEQYILWNGSG